MVLWILPVFCAVPYKTASSVFTCYKIPLHLHSQGKYVFKHLWPSVYLIFMFPESGRHNGSGIVID